MRASVRVVVAILVALVVAIVWFGRARVSEEFGQETSANTPIATTDEASSSRRTASSDQQKPAPQNAKHERLAPPSEDARTAISSLPVAEDADQHAAREASAAAHKRLLPPVIESAGEDVEAVNEEQPNGFLSLSRISCEFEGGYNNGFIWEGKLQSGTASWQAGPIVYEAIDAERGTAQMIGSAGATGSLRGHADVQVAATSNRVEFLSNLENGHFVLTTVFGQLNEQGRYIAVMSRHEGGGHYGSQFLGSCE